MEIKKEYKVAKIEEKELADIVASPSSIIEYLDKYVIGQHKAKKFLAQAVVHNILLAGQKKHNRLTDVLHKQALTIVGPTGCGKTYLATLIAGHLKIPFIDVDITNYTDSGTVGKEVISIIELIDDATKDQKTNSPQAILFIDEIDKISSKTSSRWNGLGVQRSLLKLLEGGTHSTDGVYNQAKGIKLNLDRVTFIFAGAFSGYMGDKLKNVDMDSKDNAAGFIKIDKKDKEDPILSSEDLIKAGLMPELVGRMGSVIALSGLTEGDLRMIIDNENIGLKAQQLALETLYKTKIEITDEIIDKIIETVLRQGLGARGLKKEIQRVLFEYLYY